MIGFCLTEQPGDYTDRRIGISNHAGSFYVARVDVWNMNPGKFDTDYEQAADLTNGIRVIHLQYEKGQGAYTYHITENANGTFEILWRAACALGRITFDYSFDDGLNWHLWPGTFNVLDVSSDECPLHVMAYMLIGQIESEVGIRGVERSWWWDRNGKHITRTKAAEVWGG